MGVLSWILFGLIAGGIAKYLLPGKDPGGCLVTALIGIIGAVIGGCLGTTVFNWGRVTGFALLLALYRLLVRRLR